MKMSMVCEKPASIEFTISVTATAAEWEWFKGHMEKIRMESVSPGELPTAFFWKIDNLLQQAKKVYYPETPT